MAGPLIDSTEMYLRTVLELEEEGVPALRARLAERLGLSAPSVSEGVSRLEDEGLAELAEDRTVALTPEGRDRAVHVLRKHRLAERLLVDVIGLEPEHVHEEACRWEHVISDRVEEKLLEVLGHPATSPYGNPIPGAKPESSPVTNLAEAGEGEVVVARISEQLQGDQATMQRLTEEGIHAGSPVRLERSGDEVVLIGSGDPVTLDEETARLIWVADAAHA